ncbi:NAD(P)H-dependent oxidoreductase [Pseudomonas capeferrum]
MNVLIVYAHPEPRSFNGALKDLASETLTAQGHKVQVSDLYALEWKAALDGADITTPRVNTGFLNLPAEQEHMFIQGRPTFDVEQEQAKVLWCDLLIFQFPIWWFSMPAVLKGWVDRTMTRGFAYASGEKYDNGKFKGRKAMVCVTTGTAESLYQPDGIDGCMTHILWPIHNGIFRYLGFDVLPPYVAWMPGNMSEEQRIIYLQRYKQVLEVIDEVEPLFFHPREDYGDDQRLKAGVVARSGFQWNPRAGQGHDKAADDFT